ncbi:MAG TPA: hypothetical protein VK846_12395 [Candidatus Limnocylindria bacterium]|nr:hypothetical protein [Candidatus Limnocylindria bacterium]
MAPSFEEWITHCFDHEATQPEWYWDSSLPAWTASDVITVEYVTQTFAESGTILKRFTDAQVAQGLSYIYSNSCSDIMPALFGQEVPQAMRMSCVQSFLDLFTRCFAARCSNHLSHLSESGVNVLNGVCYMWWDVIPICGEPEKAERKDFDALCLTVMQQTLELPSDACRESALHGLGHWHDYYPKLVEQVIQGFIWNNRKIRDPLRNYAYAAQHGDVQ